MVKLFFVRKDTSIIYINQKTSALIWGTGIFLPTLFMELMGVIAIA